MRSTQIIYCLFSAAGLACLSSTAFAQQDASAPQQAVVAADQLIEEVVITAERRSSDVLTTSIFDDGHFGPTARESAAEYLAGLIGVLSSMDRYAMTIWVNGRRPPGSEAIAA
jgi:hypothetical protein